MIYLPSKLPTSGLANLLGNGGLATADLFKRDILALKTVIAGTSFRNIHKVEEQLVAGTQLTLQREPDNKYDELAIKFLLDGYLLGYIPRDNNEVVARLMDAGKTFTAKVVCMEWEGTWAKVEVEVFLKD